MKFLLFVMVLLTTLTASAQDVESNVIRSACAELNNIGSIQELRRDIRRDTRRIRYLVDRYDGGLDIRRIEAVGSRLKQNIERLNTLISPEFSEPLYSQTRDWKLGPRLLRLGEGPHPYWKIRSARISRVLNWSNQQDEPLDRAQVEFRSYRIQVSLNRPASLLELCQFAQTVMVTVELDIESPRSRKTIWRNLFTESLSD